MGTSIIVHYLHDEEATGLHICEQGVGVDKPLGPGLASKIDRLLIDSIAEQISILPLK